MNPYLLLSIGIAWAVSLGGAAWLGKDYADGQCAQKELQRKKIIDEVRVANLEFADGVATQTRNAIAGIRVQHTTVNKEVRHEREIHTKVLENPDCAIPPSTVRVLNAARGYRSDGSGEGAEQPSRAVPAP